MSVGSEASAYEIIAAWNMVLARPNDPEAHRQFGVTLLHAGRTVEAAARFRLGVARFPQELDFQRLLAIATAEGGDGNRIPGLNPAPQPLHQEAAALLGDKSDDVRACCQLAAGLRRDRKFQEAEYVLAYVRHRFPEDIAGRFDFARVALERGDLTESLARWERVIAELPGQLEGYVGKAAALRSMKRFVEADACCEHAIRAFPEQHSPYIEHAWIAHEGRDWSQAMRRWQRVQAIAPHHPFIYYCGAQACWECEEFAAAERFANEAMERFPDRPEGFVRYAEIATRQHEWHEAFRRWEAVTQKFRDHADHLFHVHWCEVARMRLLEMDPGEEEAAATKPITSETSAGGADAAETDMQSVMLAFESLGGQLGGCEFGNVQRAFGAEPLSLLRWTEMTPEQLTAVLGARFEGVGDPEFTDLLLLDNHGRNEYRTADKRFGMVMHTFIHEDEITHAKMYSRSCQRLRFLKAKLLDDLTNARKIFVYKSAAQVLSDAQLTALHAAIRQYGNTWLLYVRTQTEQKPHGTVDVVAPGLMIGYIDTFSVYREGGRLSDTSEAWAPICVNAYRLWRERRESEPVSL